jgi:hypothetical protein
MRKYYFSIIVLTVLVLSSLMYGFSLAGSPYKLKAISNDSTRINHFTSIKHAVESHYSANKNLPSSLNELKNSANYNDPKTSKPYDYKVVSSTSYELCAEFETNKGDGAQEEAYRYYYTEENNYKKGYYCIAYNLPDYLINVNTSVVNTKRDGWINNKSTVIFYLDTVLTSDGEKRMIVKHEQGTTRAGSLIVVYNDAELLNVAGEKVEASNFRTDDRLIIDVEAQKGMMYKASRIQNTSR